jgi:alpha-glucan,water dikinase
MGVLIQPMIPADYAFVLHTAHPLTLDQDTMVGQVVVGLGESLVGNHPGRPFTFAARRGRDEIRVLSFPSKRTALFTERPGLMVRSDSNGEDLERLAGAGLYESVACASLRQDYVDYARCPLLTDADFRESLTGRLYQAGLEIEAAMGQVAQDVEGVVDRDGRITIVQTRAQVLATRPSK